MDYEELVFEQYLNVFELLIKECKKISDKTGEPLDVLILKHINDLKNEGKFID